MAHSTDNKVALRRDLHTLQSYATIIGILVGSGIFVLTGEMANVAGPAVPLTFVLLFPVILATAFAYSLFTSTPLGLRPGGAYIHISRTFNNYYIGFIASWLKLVAFIGAISFLAVAFGRYLTFFLPALSPVISASACLIFFFGINIIGVRYYGWIQTAMFLVLIAAVVLLVIPGLFAVNLALYDPLLPFGWQGVLAAMGPLFFSYMGFESLAQTSGETRNVRQTLPRVFLRGVTIAMLIFFFMSFVAFGVLPYQELAESASPMADVAAKFLPFGAAAIVAVGAMMAFLTSINASIIVPSRLLYVLAEDRIIPPWLAQIHAKFRTPVISLVVSLIITLGLLWTRTATYLLDIALAGMFSLYFMHNLAMMLLPFVNRELHATATVKARPAVLLVVGAFAITTMCYFAIFALPKVLPLMMIWLAGGTLLFFIGKYLGKKDGFDYNNHLTKDWKTSGEESHDMQPESTAI